MTNLHGDEISREGGSSSAFRSMRDPSESVICLEAPWNPLRSKFELAQMVNSGALIVKS